MSGERSPSVSGRDHKKTGKDARSSTQGCARARMFIFLMCPLGEVLGSGYVCSRPCVMSHLHLV